MISAERERGKIKKEKKVRRQGVAKKKGAGNASSSSSREVAGIRTRKRAQPRLFPLR